VLKSVLGHNKLGHSQVEDFGQVMKYI